VGKDVRAISAISVGELEYQLGLFVLPEVWLLHSDSIFTGENQGIDTHAAWIGVGRSDLPAHLPRNGASRNSGVLEIDGRATEGRSSTVASADLLWRWARAGREEQRNNRD